MSISFPWNSNWELIPTDQIPRSDIRNHIGQIKIGTRERMEVEHEWGPNSALDTGGHTLGGTGVAARGTSVPVSNLKAGELFIKDAVNGDIQIYLYGDIGSGIQWNLITTIDHSQLINRATGDPHPLYLLKTGNDIRPNELKMGGHILRVPSGAYNTFDSKLLWRHRKLAHNSVGNLSAIQGGSILGPKVGTNPITVTGTIPSHARATVLSDFYVMFFPEVVVKVSGGAYTKDIRFFLMSSGLQVINRTGGPVAFQARYRQASKL